MKVSLLLLSLVLTGCSIVPYQNEFTCRNKTEFGKCLDVQGAYQEAVVGGPHAKQDAQTSEELLAGASDLSDSSFNNYRSSVYQELQTLIKSPGTPVLKPDKLLRTLILPYSDVSDRQTLYMPRFVYSVVEESSWVMGEYLNKAPAVHMKKIIEKGS